MSCDLGDHSLPEPDLVVTSAPDGEGPVPAETIALVVEVSDTTLHIDPAGKASIYARYGVPEYWVADVKGAVIHQLWGAVDGAYVERREWRFGDAVVAATIDGLMIDTATLA